MESPNSCDKCDGKYRVNEQENRLSCTTCGHVISFYLWWKRYNKYIDGLENINPTAEPQPKPETPGKE